MKTEERQVDDASLIEEAISGNRAAFDRLMERHVEKSYRVARRFGLSQEDAADVIQDTYLAAYKSLHNFNFSYRFTTWITRILLNRLSNFRRGVRRAKRFFWRPLTDELTDVIIEVQSGENPQHAAERAEFRTKLEKALSMLPERQRTVFVLFEVEGFKTREIAAILEIPEGTVTSRLHHARLSLRESLKRFL